MISFKKTCIAATAMLIMSGCSATVTDRLGELIDAYIEQQVRDNSKEVYDTPILTDTLPDVKPVETPIPVKNETNSCFTKNTNKSLGIFPGDVRGKGGTLYKGKSDTRRGIVILIRASYGEASKVKFCGKNSCIEMSNAGGTNPEDNVGCRSTWRIEQNHKQIIKKTGGKTDKYRVIVDDKHEFIIRDIKKRYQ